VRHVAGAARPVSKLSDPGPWARELQHHDKPELISNEAGWRKDSRVGAEIAALVDATGATSISP
jgi:hypothetical protein